jgi:hypothetical protein
MRILYLGDDFQHSTSAHRANALRRLGHDVFHVNPQVPIMHWRVVGAMATRVGTWPVAAFVKRHVLESIRGRSFDVAWIDGGAALAPSLYRMLKRRGNHKWEACSSKNSTQALVHPHIKSSK